VVGAATAMQLAGDEGFRAKQQQLQNYNCFSFAGRKRCLSLERLEKQNVTCYDFKTRQMADESCINGHNIESNACHVMIQRN
jgi:hypothetical protein